MGFVGRVDGVIKRELVNNDAKNSALSLWDILFSYHCVHYTTVYCQVVHGQHSPEARDGPRQLY